MTVWPEVALADLCDLEIGRTPARAEPRYWGPGQPWLSIADMSQGRDLVTTKETITDVAVRECRCRLLPAGTLVMSFKLSVGKVGILRTPMFTNEAIAALRFRDPRRQDSGYMYHALRRLDFTGAGERAVKGVTLNLTSLDRLRVQMPPVLEQRRIAEILDRADGIQRKRGESLRLLDEFLRSAFLEMFGDPVTNNSGWETSTLERLVDSSRPITYGILKPGPHIPAGIPYVRVLDMEDGKVDEQRVKRTSRVIADAYRRSILRAGDVLISIRGHVGRVAVVPPALEGGNITQDTARLALLPSLAPDYVVACLSSLPMQAYMRRYVKGAAVSGINLRDVRTLSIPVPPPGLQRRFAEVAKCHTRLSVNLRETQSDTDQLFQSLAQQVFQGTA